MVERFLHSTEPGWKFARFEGAMPPVAAELTKLPHRLCGASVFSCAEILEGEGLLLRGIGRRVGSAQDLQGQKVIYSHRYCITHIAII
jgi:hypothetical protein